MSANDSEPTRAVNPEPQVFSQDPEVNVLIQNLFGVSETHLAGNERVPEENLGYEVRSKISNINMSYRFFDRKVPGKGPEVRRQFVRDAMDGINTLYLNNSKYPKLLRDELTQEMRDLVSSDKFDLFWYAKEKENEWNKPTKNNN